MGSTFFKKFVGGYVDATTGTASWDPQSPLQIFQKTRIPRKTSVSHHHSRVFPAIWRSSSRLLEQCPLWRLLDLFRSPPSTVPRRERGSPRGGQSHRPAAIYGTRVPAHPARQHGAECSNCGVRWRHLKSGAQARRAKLSHDSAVSGRVPTGPAAPAPPRRAVLPSAAADSLGNSGFF